MTLRTRRLVFWGGIALGIAGFFLILWGFWRYPRLVNYQRLALMLPLVYAAPMIWVDTFVNWSRASSYERSQAGGSLFVAVLLTVGCLLWLIGAPGAPAP